MAALRTPDERFEALPGWPCAPHCTEHAGHRVHFIDEGPRDAPFPDVSYKAALRAFPNLVPDGADAPGAALAHEAQAFRRERWAGDSFMAIGEQDPVLGTPTMLALHAHIRGCPPPLHVPEDGHFLQECGAPIAAAALARFKLA